MTRRTLILTLFLGLLVPAPAAAAPPLPTSMAAIGDSITRATDVCCWYGDHPAQSWSTGGGAFDGISSHYERIRAGQPGISGHNYNDARAGAKMSDAVGQAQTAVAQGARYVTVLMGGNDVCRDSISQMTSVVDFRAEFVSTMKILATLPSGSHVFVASIPNVYQLWALLHTNPSAELIWTLAGICQSMLSPLNTEQDRQTVLAREQQFNQVLAEVCSAYATICRFDDLAVFNYRVSTGQVSTLDYFHPSLSGQATLASITWARSWWSS